MHRTFSRATADRLFSSGVWFEAALGLVALALGYQFSLDWQSWLPRRPVEEISIGVAATVPPVLAVWLIPLEWPVVKGYLSRVFQVLGPLLRHGRLWQWAVLSLAAGWGEELFFRGLVQGGLQPYVGPWVAIGIASLVFGLLHYLNWFYALVATLMGVWLGLVFYFAQSLTAAAAAHALYDFWALWYLSRHCPPEEEEDQAGAEAPLPEKNDEGAQADP